MIKKLRLIDFFKSVMIIAFLCFSQIGLGQYSGTGQFTKITSISELTDGYYVVAYGSTTAMNNTNGGSFFGNTSITPSSNSISNPSTSIVWKIQTHVDGGRTIYNETSSKYVSYTGTSNASYAVDNVTSGSQRWTFTWSTSVFKIANVSTSTRFLQYNTSAPRFACYTGSQQDITLYKLQSTSPTISTSTTSLTGFVYNVTEGPSLEQSFTVSGTNLTNNIELITGNDNHLFSTSTGGPYVSALTLIQTGGNVPATTIYTILKSGLGVGSYADTIVCGSIGATDVNVIVDGSVVLPVPNAPTATLATNVGNNQFDANWDFVSGATSYVIDVAKTADFIMNSTNVDEDFEDGSLSNWNNTNYWTNNTSVPISGNNSLRLNAPSSQTTAYTYIQPSSYDLNTSNTTWRFNFKTGYSPSTNNRFNFYLISDNSNLINGNGYVVGINFSGTDDIIKLWKSTNGIADATPLISSTQVVSQNVVYGVEVVRTIDGNWTLRVKLGGGFDSMDLAGTSTDNSYTNSDYSGIVSYSSSSNNTNFRFDDFTIKTEVSTILTSFQDLDVGNVLTYNISGLETGTKYYYRVRALNSSGESLNSNVIEATTTGTARWTGATNTSWSIASNWSNALVPDGTYDIEIPLGSPILDTAFTVQTGRNLTISGTGSLTIAPTASLTVEGTTNFGGNSVVLQSDATGTAAIGEVSGTLSNATNVTVERYIPAKRSWRALTSPLRGSNGSLYATWQNGGSIIVGTGVEMWGPSGTNLATGPNYSVLNYTPTGWVGVNNTATTNLFDATNNNAYLVFVTGAYGSGNIASGASATTLKATGSLITGNLNYTIDNTVNTRHTLIGNPYASPLNPSQILDGSTNLVSKFWLWDPALATTGAYVSYDDILETYSNNTGSYPTSATNVQSGQAFFVIATSGNSGTLTLTESKKATGVSNVFGKNANQNLDNSNTASILRFGFYKESNQEWKPLDGAIAGFYNTANNAVDNNDGKKLANGAENIAFVRNNITLSSEHFSDPQPLDEMYIRVWNTSVNTYKLRINTESFTVPNIEATLVDLFTGVQTPIVLDGSVQEYVFAVTSAVASTGDRFKVVFSASALSTNAIDSDLINVYPNPVTNGRVNVQLPVRDYTNYSYELVNVLGQKVMSDTIETLSGNEFSINTKGLANNWYALRILHSGKAVYQTKIIIAN